MTLSRLRAHEAHISVVPMNIVFHFGVEDFQTSGKRDGWLHTLNPSHCPRVLLRTCNPGEKAAETRSN
jgi:hypothetical protein